MASEPDSDKIDRLTEILKKAKPASLLQPAPPGRSLQAGRDIQYFEKGACLSIDRGGTTPGSTHPHRSLRRALRLICLGVVVLTVPLLFSVKATHRPDTAAIRPIAAIAVDRAPDIRPAEAFTPTGPLTVVPYDSYIQLHAGCAFFRAPRRAQPNNIAAPERPRDI